MYCQFVEGLTMFARAASKTNVGGREYEIQRIKLGKIETGKKTAVNGWNKNIIPHPKA